MLVVTAPTSNIGHRVLHSVVAAGADVRVVARDAAKMSPDERERVEVLEGSHSDAAVIDRALDGADTLFWLCPGNPQASSAHESYLEFTRPAAAAIRRHGVARVVIITALGRGSTAVDRAGYVTASLAADALLHGTGAAIRSLTLPGFMDNTLRSIPTIRAQGTVYGLGAGDRRLPTVAVHDIATNAARLLLEPGWTGQQDIPLLGPEDLSSDEQAAIMADVLQTPVRYEQVAPEAYLRELTGYGFSDGMAQAMVDMLVAKDNGLDNAIERTPAHAQDAPTTFRQWCTDTLKPAFDAA
ncbi:NAD(P)H-binding protein [uncultured Jatrophihabitans sp.]|uniref:NAD(P)H-binding protein n=1 Tax=uncultured Jatrophihabitans sp. TaxID=1610747 RepID=UPI0035CAAC8D